MAHLDPRYAIDLHEILASPPTENNYLNLKTEVIRRLSLFKDQKVRQLLQSEELGDRKPSQFLRLMFALTGNKRVDDSVL